MFIPVIRRSPQDPPVVQAAKLLARGALNIPVRLNMTLRLDYPWFVPDSVRWIQNFLLPSMHGFEWGSGQSTIFFALKAATLVSVEHKYKWFRKVSKRLNKRKLSNVTYLFKPPSFGLRPSVMRPAMFEELSFQPKPEFAAYCDAILDYPSEAFDFVSVDGRARVECAINALDRLKPNGILILDNSERPKYKVLFAVLAAWPRLAFANGVWETTIFRKPEKF